MALEGGTYSLVTLRKFTEFFLSANHTDYIVGDNVIRSRSAGPPTSSVLKCPQQTPSSVEMASDKA